MLFFLIMNNFPFIKWVSIHLKHFQSHLNCLIHEHYIIISFMWHIEWETRSFMNLPSFDILWKTE